MLLQPRLQRRVVFVEQALRALLIDELRKAGEPHQPLADHGTRAKHHPIQRDVSEDHDAADGGAEGDRTRARPRRRKEVE